jgi:hypothetical protein
MVLSVGALAFLWFAWSLRERLRADGGELTFTFGSVFRGGRRGGGHGAGDDPRGAAIRGHPVPTGALAQQLSNLGGGLAVVAGALSASLFVGLASHLPAGPESCRDG